MLKQSNEIRITKVANGWVVHMPRPYDVPEREDFSRSVNESLQQFMPAIRELMKARDEDPLLASLQGEEEEPRPEPVVNQPPKIGLDPHVFVFSSFISVLQLLEDHFGDE